MLPLTLIFLLNIALVIVVLLSIIRRKKVGANLIESIRQLGGLALAWGAFSTVIGLYFAFKSLEELKNTVPFEVIMGGLKVALITVIYGLIIFIVSLVSFLGLRTANDKLVS